MRITPGWQGKTKGRGRTRLDSMKLIKPHGGKLVNREVTGGERDRLIQAAINMPALGLNAREISELEMIATGAYSPLEGFLDRSDYASVCARMQIGRASCRDRV